MEPFSPEAGPYRTRSSHHVGLAEVTLHVHVQQQYFTGRYRGTSIIRNRRPLGPYSRTMPRALWGSEVVGPGPCNTQGYQPLSSESGTPLPESQGQKQAATVLHVPHSLDSEVVGSGPCVYRGTSLIRKRRTLEPYSRTMSRALWGSEVVGPGPCDTQGYQPLSSESGTPLPESQGQNQAATVLHVPH